MQSGVLLATFLFSRGIDQHVAVQGHRLSPPFPLKLRGGGKQEKSFEGILSKKGALSEQERLLQKRKQMWRDRFGDSNSDDFSDEEVLDRDRPDFYKRPIPPPPDDDFSRSGLPAWLDPVYDNADPKEYLMTEILDEDNTNQEIGWETDVDSSDLVDIGKDPETGEPTIGLKPLPGDESFSDKEFTLSELDELERIWHGNDRGFCRYSSPSEDPSENVDGQKLAALPWEEGDAKKDDDSQDGESAVTARLRLRASSSQAAEMLEGAGADLESDASAGARNEKRLMLQQDSSRAAKKQRKDRLLVSSNTSEVALNYTAMVENALLYDDADHDAITLDRDRVRKWDDDEGSEPPPQYENDNWPHEPGVCAPDRHPLEYQVSDERLNYWCRRGLRELAQSLVNLTLPEEELRRQEEVVAAWGFCPLPGEIIPGFNEWNTSEPPPPSPPVTVKAGDLVVPDTHATIPLAVAACEDGGRVTVRGGSNHTWIGQGLRTSRGRLVDRYDSKMMTRRRPDEEQAQLMGRVAVPSHGSTRSVFGLVATELEPHDTQTFCLHLSAEPSARIGGRWLLRGSSVGSFTGAECVFEVNSSNTDMDLQHLLSTVEVRGGPWLLQHCGLRSCGAVAVDCTRRSLVKLRHCAVGGISHQRRDHSETGRALLGLFCRDFCRCVISHCTVEQTGCFFMPAVRCAGLAQVTMSHSLLQRNAFGVGILDRVSVHVSNCTTRHNDQAAFFAEERKGEVTDRWPLAAEHASARLKMWNLETAPFKPHYPIPKLAKREVYWDRSSQRWAFGNPQPTVRIDPVFGNLTDGWRHGLPGWTDGVPRAVCEAAEEAARQGLLPLLPDHSLLWGEGPVGCTASKMVANGTLPGNCLTPGFNAGAHEAKLVVSDCLVVGKAWATRGRPGTMRMRNVTTVRDPWVEKYYGNASHRKTVRQQLEAIGMRWDRRRRTYLKPVRMVNGTVVYVRWNETRFSRDAPGGYPGTPDDYPKFDPVTNERLHNRNLSKPVQIRRVPSLGYETEWHPDDDAMWERRRRKAVKRRLRAEARARSEAQERQEQHESEMEGGRGGAMVEGSETWRDAAIDALLHKWWSRPAYKQPFIDTIEGPFNLLDGQPR